MADVANAAKAARALAAALATLSEGRHGDPFALLGPQRTAAGDPIVRALLPLARAVALVGEDGARMPMIAGAAAGVFEAPWPEGQPYRLEVTWPEGPARQLDDPYRFGPVLGEMDAWLLAEGTHLRPFEVLGAHPRARDGVPGTDFAVWAPNARRVSV